MECSLCSPAVGTAIELDCTTATGQYYSQGLFFNAGVRVFPAGILQIPQEILTKTLIIEQILGFLWNFNKIFTQNRYMVHEAERQRPAPPAFFAKKLN